MQIGFDIGKLTTNLVRRPIDGHVRTCSGRLIPQPPWIIPTMPITQALYDQWLIDEGRNEASDVGDDWLICRLDGVDAQCMDEDLRYMLSDYLFGIPNPQFEARKCIEV